VRPLRALPLDHRLERLDPLLGLEGVGIVGGVEIGDGSHGDLSSDGDEPCSRALGKLNPRLAGEAI
jgi:hypothetical protein